MALHKTPKSVRSIKGKLMKRKIKNPSIRPGMQLGELYVEKRVATPSGSSGGQRWSCLCSCGDRLTIPQWYLMRKEHPKRHCGHLKDIQAISLTRERGIWYMMHRRCYNDTHVAYKHYGGGDPKITVCDSWNKDVVGVDAAWQGFIKDMGPAPSRKYTLDRIDPYNGYGWQIDRKGELTLNCRWATATQQMNNLKRHWPKPEEAIAAQEIEAFSDVADGEDGDDDDDNVGEQITPNK